MPTVLLLMTAIVKVWHNVFQLHTTTTAYIAHHAAHIAKDADLRPLLKTKGPQLMRRCFIITKFLASRPYMAAGHVKMQTNTASFINSLLHPDRLGGNREM
jgi:hypothetical protein